MFSKIRKILNVYTVNSELKYLAYHDSLTGTLNRNWFYKNLNVVSKYNYIYFIDINDLRKINEKGHTFGDEHIKNVVKFLNTKSGILIRYAGDEFILFSNKGNAIKSCNLVSVGCCKNDKDIMKSINLADVEMIKEKKKWKIVVGVIIFCIFA